MSGPHAEFVGTIPENYDQGLGPHIFVDYAADLAARTAKTSPQAVLELAAGTGFVTRLLRDALPASATLTVSDLNVPMLEVAKAKFEPSEAVTFEEVDAMTLPFGDASFDTLVCQFGVMFFPDKPASFVEAHRVLRDGGRYLFNVWDKMEANPFSIVAHEAASRFFADDPPQFYKVPFGYSDTTEIEAALRTAGFSDVTCTHVALDKVVLDLEPFAQGIVFGNPIVDEIRSRGGDPDAVKAAVLEGLKEKFDRAGKMPLSAFVFDAKK